MDNFEITNPSVDRLTCFLKSTLVVDYPLYASNPKYGIKIAFDDLDDMCAHKVARCILECLLHQKGFWVCEYGSDSLTALIEKHVISASPVTSEIIPHECTTVDKDWFYYDVAAISCNYVKKADFCFDEYIRHAFRLDFLSNAIFLVDDEQEFAIHIYDRRGMDVVSTNTKLLDSLCVGFSQHILMKYSS